MHAYKSDKREILLCQDSFPVDCHFASHFFIFACKIIFLLTMKFSRKNYAHANVNQDAVMARNMA